MRKTILILAVLFSCPVVFSADTPPVSGPHKHSITLGINSEALAGIEIGYAHLLPLFPEKKIHLYYRLSFPLIRALESSSLDTWTFKTGGHAELLRRGKFGLSGDFYCSVGLHHQVLGTFIPVAINLRIIPGYYFSKGYLAFQVNWNQTLATHISHSDYVKESFTNLNMVVPNLTNIHPQNGWYRTTGSFFSAGIETKCQISQSLEVYGDLGIISFTSAYTGFFDAMMIGDVPFYGTVRFCYSF